MRRGSTIAAGAGNVIFDLERAAIICGSIGFSVSLVRLCKSLNSETAEVTLHARCNYCVYLGCQLLRYVRKNMPKQRGKGEEQSTGKEFVTCFP